MFGYHPHKALLVKLKGDGNFYLWKISLCLWL